MTIENAQICTMIADIEIGHGEIYVHHKCQSAVTSDWYFQGVSGLAHLATEDVTNNP